MPRFISAPSLIQAKPAIIMPTCSSLSAGFLLFGERSFSSLVTNSSVSFLQETCCSTRGSFTSWQGAQGVQLCWWCLCLQSYVAAWRGNTSSSQCLQVSREHWLLPGISLFGWRTVCRLGSKWPQLGGCLSSSQISSDPVKQKAVRWQASVTTSGVLS